MRRRARFLPFFFFYPTFSPPPTIFAQRRGRWIALPAFKFASCRLGRSAAGMSFPPVSLAVYFPAELEPNAEQGSGLEIKTAAMEQSKLVVLGYGL